MRVYELAKKLGMENKALLPELKKLGIAVSSHSSALDDDAVQKVLSKFHPSTTGEGKSGLGQGEQGVRVGHTKGGVAKSQGVEQSAKPDKRRILIKRKKEDEPADVLSSAPTVDSESAASVAPAPVPAPSAREKVR